MQSFLKPIQESLHFDPQYFLFQIVLFLLLWAVMNALFWKPMLAHLDGRAQRIKDAYKHVEDTRHEMEALRNEYQSRIAQIEAEARARIQAAIKEAQTERERLLAEARAQSEAALKQGIANMEREKTEALTALRERMVGLAVEAAEKALGATADANLLRRSIEERIPRGATNGATPT